MPQSECSIGRLFKTLIDNQQRQVKLFFLFPPPGNELVEFFFYLFHLGDEPGGLTFLFLFSFSFFFLSSVSANKISRLAIEDFSVSQAHIL